MHIFWLSLYCRSVNRDLGNVTPLYLLLQQQFFSSGWLNFKCDITLPSTSHACSMGLRSKLLPVMMMIFITFSDNLGDMHRPALPCWKMNTGPMSSSPYGTATDWGKLMNSAWAHCNSSKIGWGSLNFNCIEQDWNVLGRVISNVKLCHPLEKNCCWSGKYNGVTLEWARRAGPIWN